VDAATGVVNYYYFNEEAVAAWLATPNNVIADIPNANGLAITVTADIVNNFEQILEQTTTYGSSTTTKIKEIIKQLASQSEGNVIYKNIAATGDPANWVFQYWTGTAYETISLNDIVAAGETKTKIERKSGTGAYVEVTTEPTADADVIYKYSAEDGTNYINVTADVLESITNNENIQNEIKKILNIGGNVYYGEVTSGEGNVFYTVAENGTKTPIDLSGVVINAIVTSTPAQKQVLKNVLGDDLSGTTVVNTGDTWVDGRKIYKGVYSASVAAGTANVSDITIAIPEGATALGSIVSLKILNATTNTIINVSTTDVTFTGGVLKFKIGTGSMYTVLSQSLLNIKVVVEFSATTN